MQTYRKLRLYNARSALAGIENVRIGRDEVLMSKTVDVCHHVLEIGGEVDLIASGPHYLDTWGKERGVIEVSKRV